MPLHTEGAARGTRAPCHTAALAPLKQGRLETQNQGAMPVDAAKVSSKYTCGTNYGACWIERSSTPGCQAIASRRTTEAPAARAAALAGGCGAAATRERKFSQQGGSVGAYVGMPLDWQQSMKVHPTCPSNAPPAERRWAGANGGAGWRRDHQCSCMASPHICLHSHRTRRMQAVRLALRQPLSARLGSPTVRCAPYMSQAAAGAKRKADMKIGTHSGSFHCDEALGCALLQKLDKFAGASIVRSRDPAVLAECDIVLDVGGVYDPGVARRRCRCRLPPAACCLHSSRGLHATPASDCSHAAL